MSTLKTNNIQHVDRSDPSIIINTDGGVSIAGTLTYEDVTSVDAVGIVTGRELINAQKQIHVGTGVSVKAGGINVTAGITTVQALQAQAISGTTGTFSAAISGTTGTFTGDVDIADKIVHTGDTNTAIRFPSADTFTVETAGSERFRIDSTGNTLIYGVLRKDNVSSSLAITGGNAADSSANIVLHGSGGSPANVTQFRTGSTERMRISSGGDVGVGNDAPSCKLAVTDTATHTAYAKVTPSVGDCMLALYNNPSSEAINNHSTIQLAVNGGSHNRVNTISAVAESASSRKMATTFCTDSSSNRGERMRITGDGLVGIGTDIPQQKVDVHNNSGTTLIRASVNGNSRVGVEIAKTGATTQTWRIQDGQSGNGILEFYDQTDSRSVMVLNGTGKVGINETSPDQLLHITDGNPFLEIEGTSNSGDAGIFINAKANHWLLRADNYGSQNMFTIKSGDTSSSTHRWAINSSGYMAVGNTNPQQLVHVWPDIANTNQAWLRVTAGDRGSNTGIQIGHDINGNGQIQVVSNGAMYFATNDTNRMSLRNDHPDLVVGATGGWTDYNTVQAPIMAYGTSSYPANCHAMKAVLTNTSFSEDGGGALFIGVRRSTTSDYTMAGWYTGNGSNSITADRQFRFIGDGNAYADGSWTGGGADYAEFFEWLDGNSSDENRKGISVVLDNGKIRPATGSDNTDNIIGVISANPVVVGDSASERWKEKWITDDFGDPVYEEYTVTEWYDETKKEKVNYDTDRIPSDVTVGAGSSILSTDHKGNVFTRKKLNPSWDSTATYIPRKDRKEWDIVGLMGKLKVKSDQPVGTKWIKMREISASVHEYLIR